MTNSDISVYIQENELIRAFKVETIRSDKGKIVSCYWQPWNEVCKLSPVCSD